ncbi:MAG: ABC transporter permease [Clostridiales bacterium]|nr:ABC transporter permease [Clostridiales bacterium]
MFKYIVKRLLLSVIILLGVSFIVYALVRMMPMNYVEIKYASQLAQGTVKQEDIDNFLKLYGLSDSVIVGYFRWLGSLLTGDLGISFKYEQPVGTVIGDYMWISFAIALIATILQFLIAIPLGISSATHQYSVRDYTVTVLTMIGLSFPTYFFAAICIRVFSVELGWLPSGGLVDPGVDYATDFVGTMTKLGDMAYHLILPIIVSVVLSVGGLMRYTRTNTLEVLNADYIRTARAKGLSERTVIYKHAFRNTLIPLATLLAGIIPGLFGGMMITEEVFAIDGIGRMAYRALVEGDIPFVMGYNMFLAVLTVIGTLFSDIMYAIVDPRVKLTK